MHLKRITASLALLLLLSPAASVAANSLLTSVTVQATTISNWRYGGATAKLRIYANESFFQAGVQIIAGRPGSGQWYQEVSCTVASTTVSCPSFTLAVTTNSPDNPNAKFTSVLVDSKGTERDKFLADFAVPESYGATVTWEQLRLYGAMRPAPRRDTYPTTDQVNSLVNAAVAIDASATVQGTTKLSVEAAVPTNPIAVGDNDARVNGEQYVGEYASLAAAVTAIGATQTTLVVHQDSACSTAITIPATLTFRFTNTGKITKSSGCTLTFQGIGITGQPTHQIFSGFAAGDFTWSNERPEFFVEWFGGRADTTTDNVAALNTLTAILSAGGSINLLSGKYRLASSLSLPAGVRLNFAAGAILKPDSAVTITLTGAEIEAGRQQIFELPTQAVEQIQLISGGGTASAVTFTGGGGSGAAATLVGGVLTLTNGGSGYTTYPTISFTGGTSPVAVVKGLVPPVKFTTTANQAVLPEWFGLSTASTDNTRAIQTAYESIRYQLTGSTPTIATQGGKLSFGRGVFRFASPLQFHVAYHTTLEGSTAGNIGSISANNNPTTLLYTGTGSGIAVDARSSQAFSLRDIALLYSSTSFTGTLLDLSQTVAGSSMGRLEKCGLGANYDWASAYLPATAHTILKLSGSYSMVVDGCFISGGQRGILGGGDANIINILNSQFMVTPTAAIVNSGQMWTIKGNNFEGSYIAHASFTNGGMPYAYLCEGVNCNTEPQFYALTFEGNWMGDRTSYGGAYIKPGRGLQLNVSNNFFGGGFGGATLELATGTTGKICGNNFNGGMHVLDLQTGASSTIDVVGNRMLEPEAAAATLIGTISTTSGNPAVTGVGTNFTLVVEAGMRVIVNGVLYTIQSVGDNISLTLTTNAASTLSGVAIKAVYENVWDAAAASNAQSGLALNWQGNSTPTNIQQNWSSATPLGVGVPNSIGLARLTVRGAAAYTLSGTSSSNGTTTITGDSNSVFLYEVPVGAQIVINGNTRIVTAVTDNHTLTVNATVGSSSGQSVTCTPPPMRVDTSAGAPQLMADGFSNLHLGGYLERQGATGSLVMYDTANLPSANPTGSIILSSQSGVLKYRDAAGNTTTGSGNLVFHNGPTFNTPTLVEPTIASFVNANHSHTTSIGGGQLNASNVFNAGVVPPARGGTGIDSTGSTGVARVNSGTWSFDASVTHLSTFSSADLAGRLTDEVGDGGGFVRANNATLVAPNIGAATGTSINLSGATVAASVNLGGATLLDVLTNTASLDYAQALATTCEALTVTVTSAADGDTTDIGIPHALANHNTTATFTAWVSSANTVSIRRCVLTADGSDPAAAIARATVFKF